MGPQIFGQMKELVGKPSTLDDGRPGGFYLARFRNLSERQSKFIRGYGFEGHGGSTMFPKGTDVKGFGASFKEQIRENQGSYIGMGGFGEVLARYENYVDLDPKVQDKWGVPALRFHYRFGDNEKRMAEDVAESTSGVKDVHNQLRAQQHQGVTAGQSSSQGGKQQEAVGATAARAK